MFTVHLSSASALAVSPVALQMEGNTFSWQTSFPAPGATLSKQFNVPAGLFSLIVYLQAGKDRHRVQINDVDGSDTLSIVATPDHDEATGNAAAFFLGGLRHATMVPGRHCEVECDDGTKGECCVECGNGESRSKICC